MSERYTVEYGEDARLVMIVNHKTKDAYTIFQACRELNRLSAEVATLRELLRKAYSYAPIELASEIYAVIQPTMESPWESGDEAARPEAEE